MTEKFELLDRLETKIAKTISRITELQERCDALQKDNEHLAAQLAGAKKQNSQLTEQMAELKAASQIAGAASVRESEALKRIDRMLEKFGELQI